MKQCTKCRQWKSIERYSILKIRNNGNTLYKAQCKDCINEAQRQYKNRNKEKFAEYHRKYRAKPEVKQYYKEYDRKPEVLARKNIQQKLPEVKKRRYLARKARYHLPENEMRYNARAAVRRAINKGILPKVSTLTCSNCNVNQAIHYHHHAGYDKANRLNVMPVCQDCHLILDGFREA